MSIQEIFQQVQSLPIDEQTELIKLLIDAIAHPQRYGQKKRSLLELEGLGADIWDGVDAQEYVKQLRDEWDDVS